MNELFTNNIVITIGLSLFAYIIGSIPFGLLISKKLSKIDIREHGSGNMGATNITRVLGKRNGLYVFLFDCLVKGFLTTFIAKYLYQQGTIDVAGYFIGVFAVIGHIYPVFANFKGGKGVATSYGLLLAVNPLLFLLLILVFFVIVSITKWVSLGSIIAIPIGAIILIFTKEPNILEIASLLYLAFIIVYKHKENIKRIINGNENKLNLGKK